MRLRRIVTVLVAVIVIGGAGFAWLAYEPAIPASPPDAHVAFDKASVEKGAELASVGNCISCHTVPGQPAFSGGLAVPTPFGTIHSTNITPDDETGIGLWTEAAFERAMRTGVDRQGNHLYPAFPYDHFTRVTADDDKALYAFLMTRQPVHAEAKANSLIFPLQFRPLLAGWKLLFLKPGPLPDDKAQSAAWNRGRYLAEGLGHCGACHTPRNSLGAERDDQHFAGAEAEGWQAYAINRNSRAPVAWDAKAIAFYLRNGWHPWHGVSRGPMAEVTGNLDRLPDSDIAAIATYVASVMGEPSADRKAQSSALQAELAHPARPVETADSQRPIQAIDANADKGETIYQAACANCHESGRQQPFGGLNFKLSTAVQSPNPQNIINVTLFGLPPSDGQAAAVMPAFAGTLDDQQIGDLLAYLRGHFSKEPAWSGVVRQVADTRDGKHKVAIHPSDGIERSPRNVGAKEQ